MGGACASRVGPLSFGFLRNRRQRDLDGYRRGDTTFQLARAWSEKLGMFVSDGHIYRVLEAAGIRRRPKNTSANLGGRPRRFAPKRGGFPPRLF